jgi:methyl-accepting chemotaxis protein
MDLHVLSAVQGALADTVVTIQARDRIALAADLAVLVAAAAMTVLAVALVRLLVEWRRMVVELRGTVRQNLGPVSDRARSISDNVQFITQALRSDVERLNASVKALTARLHQASSRMEERIEEFNALMELVQSEAEEVFLDTAATVRGVREGARAMGRGRQRSDSGRHTDQDDLTGDGLEEHDLLPEPEDPDLGDATRPAEER